MGIGEVTRGELQQLMRDKVRWTIDKLEALLASEVELDGFVVGWAETGKDGLTVAGGGEYLVTEMLLAGVRKGLYESPIAEVIDERD